ncbi:MAG: ShlB/FhaC/HecB family hemolysin secretion/activation protein [Sphingomonadales bacterium]|nr:ShlB/FhaC/HecB family hemolysin secretion/activation protein [Sphingomonadales bacterium]
MRGFAKIMALAGMLAGSIGHAATPQTPSAALHVAIAAPAPRAPVAAPAPAAAPAPLVGAVRISLPDAAGRFAAADFIGAAAPFVGRTLSGEDLQDLLSAVSGVARGRGYILAHGVIPAQRLASGVLDLRLTLGRIDRIELSGDDAPAVRARLEQLIGAPLTRSALQRQLTLARDLPGMTVDRLAITQQDGETVLSARVRHKHGTVRGGLDNWGNSAVGPVRARLAYDFNGLLGNDRLSGTVEAVAAAQPDELAAVSVRLAYDLDNLGTRVEFTGVYSHSNPGASLAPYALSGDYAAFGVELSRPLVRGFAHSLWLSGGLRMVTLDRWQAGVLGRHDKALIANLGLNGNVVLAGGRLRGGIGVSHLLDALDATRAGDPLATRPGAGAGATFASAWLDWQGKLSGPLSAWVALNGQVATAPLPVTAQISLGGPMFGRAYDFGERTGDNGLLAMAELRYTLRDRNFGLLRFAQLYGFADAGSVGNVENDLGTGTLASAGAGARLTLTEHFRIGMEAALPVNQPRYASGDRSPRYRASLGFQF